MSESVSWSSSVESVSWTSYECRGKSEDEWGSRIDPGLFSWFQSKAGVRVGRTRQRRDDSVGSSGQERTAVSCEARADLRVRSGGWGMVLTSIGLSAPCGRQDQRQGKSKVGVRIGQW